MIGEIAGTSALAALALRPHSWVLTGLHGYVLAVADVALLTTTLSPFRGVTRFGICAGQTALLSVALVSWLLRGRPRLPKLVLPRKAWREPALAVLGAGVLASTLYELVPVFAAPPNNWDSLTYHLARAAAWTQHGGVYWIPGAPTDRTNEFQPLAEQQVLMLFGVARRVALFALPQFLAGCAATLGIYAVSRHLGHARRPAAFAALLFATFPLVALEATTAQNDLVAAALPVIAAALILGGSAPELALGGVALGLAIGVKLTTALILPIPLALALLRSRAALARTLAWLVGSFAALGIWGFVLNAIHTGHLLGRGGGRVAQQASPSLTGTPTTAFRVLYGLFDLSGLDLRLATVLAGLGLVVALMIARGERRAGRGGRAWFSGIFVLLVFSASRLVPVAAHGLHLVANAVHLPVDAPATTGGHFFWGIDYGASEDLSAFGAIGGLLLLGLSFRYLLSGDRATRVLGAALPLFVLLLSLTSKYNPWLSRFLLVPVALAAPLAASVARRRPVAVSIAVLAVLQLALVHVRNEQKPLVGSSARAWFGGEAGALLFTFRPDFAEAYRALGTDVPAGSCVGAVVGGDDPSFLLFGARLQRRVVFLPRASASAAADAHGIGLVVVSGSQAAEAFSERGWVVRSLGAGTWRLAVKPRAGTSNCR